jgi:recombination protein RecT
MSQNLQAIKHFFESDNMKNRITELMGKQANTFIASVLQIVSSNADFSKVDKISIYNAAMMAATLQLPINKSLGYAWIIPYNEKYKDEQGTWQTKSVAQFQIGYKGFVQLAIRSNQYKNIGATEVYASQFNSFDTLTEELDADFSIEPEEGEEVIGYAFRFKLHNGFEKTMFWTKKKAQKHMEKFSKSHDSSKSPWKTNFDGMALKSLVKAGLSKWGILSIDMQKAIEVDQSVIAEDEQLTYPDNDFELVETKLKVSSEDLVKIKQGILDGQYDLTDVQERYHFTESQLSELQKP